MALYVKVIYHFIQKLYCSSLSFCDGALRVNFNYGNFIIMQQGAKKKKKNTSSKQ